MRITKEQWEDIKPMYFHSLPIEGDDDQDFMYEVFNVLPDYIKADGLAWGCEDSVFRDNAFTYLLKTQFDLSVDAFYRTERWKHAKQKFDFSKYDQ